MKEIVQDGAPVLRKVAAPVPEELFGTPELARMIKDMEEALDKEPDGVALAAPQIAISYQIFIVRKDRTLPPLPKGTQSTPPSSEIEVYINPKITRTSRKRAARDEGCLSVRGIYGTTNRHERVTIKARRPDGTHVERGAGGLMAQIFEHEIDHLNGILFIDHATELVRVARGAERRFAYFGTPKVSSDTLSILIENGFVPSVVITSPDAPRGRGLTLTPSETKVVARAHDIPVLTPERLDADTIAAIRTYECDYALVVAYGKIFPEALIESFPHGVLNVHYSLLPKYRGATPMEAALLAGDPTTGVTIQKMVKELDAGDIIAQQETTIDPEETARELRPRLIEMGAGLLVATLPDYVSDAIIPTSQDHTKASRSRKIKKEEGQLSLDAPALENWNKYRAYADTIGTYFFENGKRIKITSAALKHGKFVIERIIPEGKREMSYADFSKK